MTRPLPIKFVFTLHFLTLFALFFNFVCKTLANDLAHRKSNIAPSQQFASSFQTFSSPFLSTTGSRSPARAISSFSHLRPQSRRFLTTTTNTKSHRLTMSTPTSSKNHLRDSRPTLTSPFHAVFSTARSAASKMVSRASTCTSPNASRLTAMSSLASACIKSLAASTSFVNSVSFPSFRHASFTLLICHSPHATARRTDQHG